MLTATDPTKPQPLGRRGFACALCAVLAGAATLRATPARAAWGATGPDTFRRTLLGSRDYPDGKHIVLQAKVEIDANAVIPRHTHPGIESAFITEGSGLLVVAGQADRQVGPGDSFEIPPETIHGVRNGPATMKVLITYVVEKGKPLATIVPD